MGDLQALILAAGKGTRMKINGSKLLYRFNGDTIIKRVVNACKIPKVSKINLIVGYESEKIISELGNDFRYYFQENLSGTGEALRCFFENNNYEDDLLVLVGDTPLLSKKFILNFTDYYYNNSLTTLLAVTKIENNIPPYARVIRDNNNNIIKILEDFECDFSQKKITEVVTSQYCFNSKYLKPLLNKIKPKGKNNNTYLNDIINEKIKLGEKIDTYFEENYLSLYGVNDKNDLLLLKNEISSYEINSI